MALRRLAQRSEARGWASRASIIEGLAGPAGLALLILGLKLGVASPWMSPSVYDFASKPLRFLFVIVIYWYAYNLVDVIGVVAQAPSRRRFGSKPSDRAVGVPFAPFAAGCHGGVQRGSIGV